MYRGDPARSGGTSERLPDRLSQLWIHRSSQPPRPAWPAPAKGSYWQKLDSIEPRITDDHIFHPVVGESSVYYGSSADDQIYCLDTITGNIRWTFFTDGPVRYAPVIFNGRIYAGSDDGFVYCLSANKGELIWRYRCGPNDYRVSGNGRMISAWPVRTGLVVQDGAVSCLAGLYPSQGVYACGLSAQDGSVLWTQRISEYSPQGYLLASANRLYVPTGRTDPIALDLHTGKFVQAYSGVGGTYALLAGDTLVAGRGNDGTLVANDEISSDRLVSINGKHLVVTSERSYLLDGTHLSAIDRLRFTDLSRQIVALEKQQNQLQQRRRKPVVKDQEIELRIEMGKLAVQIDELKRERNTCQLWKVPCLADAGMILAGQKLIVGGEDQVNVYSAINGDLLQTLRVDGRAGGLAAANRQLIVSTDLGTFHCFGIAPGTEVNDISKTAGSTTDLKIFPAQMNEKAAGQFQLLTQTLAGSKGYGLILGAENAGLIQRLINETDLKLVVVDGDPTTVARLRSLMMRTGAYGTRISVHHIDGDQLPFTDYFANTIIDGSVDSNDTLRSWSESEIKRVLRPNGGALWKKPYEQALTRGPLEGAGEWTHLYANSANTSSTEDKLIHEDVVLQWFGGPGPRRMVDRHLRAPAPLVANGRLFVLGENTIIGVDAYNGTELWETELPGSQRYSMPYDAGYATTDGDHVFIAVRDECWILDAATGKRIRTLGHRGADGIVDGRWGYVGLWNDRLFGTVQFPTASRQTPSRHQIDIDYLSNQPVVTGRAFFCMDPESGDRTWKYQRGVIVNPTITIADGRIYFIESFNEKVLHDQSGRIPLDVITNENCHLVALDAATGERVIDLPIDLPMCRSVLYMSYANDSLVIVGSGQTEDKDAGYSVRVLDGLSGQEYWRASHSNQKPGALGHGEQVHHPVLLGETLIAEPVLYNQRTGARVNPDSTDNSAPWFINRPGHSCGTMSGAGDCVFFRANNPTVMTLDESLSSETRFRKLSPSRVGCWINIIPAQGLVLIPEASSGCVCGYALQTSMAFRPVKR